MLNVDPKSDQSWKSLQQHIRTDEVHAKDRLNPTIETPGGYVSSSYHIISEIYSAPITKRTYTMGALQKSAKS